MSLAVRGEPDLAAQVLDEIRVQAGATVEAEVTVDRVALALTRFANSVIHQNVAEVTTAVRLRLHLAGRTATGSTTMLHREGLADLVARTVAAARLLPPDPGWPGLAPPAALGGAGTVDQAVVNASPDDRSARVRAFVEAARGLSTAGYFRTLHWVCTFANSAGHSVVGATTEAAMDGIVRTAGADGVARAAGSRMSDVEGHVLGARATAKALGATDPVELPPGRYEVVLEPTAVVDVLEKLALYGFNGKVVNERRSFLELDTCQFDESMSIVDDPLSGVGLPFDAEGTPKLNRVMVGSGVTSLVAHDRRTAAEAGTRSTGHALPGAAAWGPFPSNLAIAPADGPPVVEVDGPAADSAVAALVAGVRRGVLVTDHWYTRVLDPRPLVVTGLTRNGVWEISNGEVGRPVKNFRFTQSYPQALAPGAVLGIGAHAATHPSGWEMYSYRAPALRLAAWNFTGGASG